MLKEINIAVNKIDKQLKGFQSASVDYVLEQMYTKHRKKVLIAVVTDCANLSGKKSKPLSL